MNTPTTSSPLASAPRTAWMFTLGLCALAFSCSEKTDAKPPAARIVGVGVVEVEASAVTLTSELAGRISAYQTSEVRPQVNGIIKSREFKEGSEVRAGQPLYKIDSARYRATHAEAKAGLESAKASVTALESKAERYRSLVGSEAVSRQEVDDAVASARSARAAVAQAEAALQTSRINLGYTTINAPIAGRIGRSAVTAGALVTANQTTSLATIQQLDPIYVDITQSSAELLEFRRALASGEVLPATAKIKVVLEDGTTYPLEGTLEFAEAMVDSSSGSVTLRALFPNPSSVLLPGMFVRALAPQALVPQGLLVPQQGISRDAKGGATALVVVDNKVELRKVEAVRAIGDKWLIGSGLAAGDKLIVEGVGKVRPGAEVKAEIVSLDAPLETDPATKQENKPVEAPAKTTGGN